MSVGSNPTGAIMKVTYDSGDVLIRMTADQLITLRYALHEGNMKLQMDAIHLTSMKAPNAKDAKATAKKAKAVNEALEAANQAWVHRNTPE